MNGIYLYFVNKHLSSWPLLGLQTITFLRPLSIPLLSINSFMVCYKVSFLGALLCCTPKHSCVKKTNLFVRCFSIIAEPHGSVGCAGLEKRRRPVRSPVWPIFLPRIHDSHCDMIHSSLSLCCLLFRQLLRGKAASGLEGISC